MGHSVHMEENYNYFATILEKIKYQEFQWMVCGDFKILTMLLGQQSGYTKFPCFLCLWDSRARELHWTTTDWPPRHGLINSWREKRYQYHFGSARKGFIATSSY